MAATIPSVDQRLCDAKKAFASLMLITRALSSGDELALTEEIPQWGWSEIGDIAEGGCAAVDAAYDALPDLSYPAPDVPPK